MKKMYMGAAALAAAFMITMASVLSNTPASALADNGFTRLLTSYCSDCYADIVIEGDHFTVDGRVVNDPVVKVRLSVNDAVLSDYEFTTDGYSFHAEFNCSFSDSFCYLWLVQESNITMSYLLQHDEKGWSFPDNGLTKLNAEKLENIRTAPPEASAYYLSETADPDEIEETLSRLRQLVQEICGDEEDDYVKALLIYRWVVENIYYDKDAAATEVTLDTVAVHNVLERRRTTCAGYSNTYCAMLEAAGIRSVNLKGSAVGGEVNYSNLLTGGENHEFTAFWYEAENRWAYVDPTWGSYGRYENGEYSYLYPPSDKYFDVTGESFALNHRADKAEERNYTGVLAALKGEETEETDGTEVDTDTPQSTEETEAQTTTTAAAPSQSKETPRGGSLVIYIVIGAAGVVTVIAGMILAIRKR